MSLFRVVTCDEAQRFPASRILQQLPSHGHYYEHIVGLTWGVAELMHATVVRMLRATVA